MNNVSKKQLSKAQEQVHDTKLMVFLPNNQTEMIMSRKVLEVTWEVEGEQPGFDLIETINLEYDEDLDENSSGMCSFTFKNRMFLIGGKDSRTAQF